MSIFDFVVFPSFTLDVSCELLTFVSTLFSFFPLLPHVSGAVVSV